MQSSAAIEEPPLLLVRPLRVNDVAQVWRREAKPFISSLYMRRHLVEGLLPQLNEFIASDSKDQLYLAGSPGCGKTCFIYLWARLLAVAESKRVLIVQFRPLQPCFLWIRDGNAPLVGENFADSKLLVGVENVLKKNEEAQTSFDLCIHDGAVDDNESKRLRSTLNNAIVNETIKKVIHVTSLAFHLTTGGQNLGDSGSIVQLSCDSWRLQDYLDAINHEGFAKTVEPKLLEDQKMLEDQAVDEETTTSITLADVVEAKYYYAGGSARFMFDFTLKKLIPLLDEYCNRVARGDWNYFAVGAVSTQTPTSVNTFMQQFGGVAAPLSKYILAWAYENCQTDLVNAVKAAADRTKNPALRGWAFELAQIELIRSSIIQSKSESMVQYYVASKDRKLGFCPRSSIDYDGAELLKPDDQVIENGTVIFCLKWNQGCFDVAYYEAKTLVTIQFTISETHNLKPSYIRTLRDALVENKVEVNRCVHIAVGNADNLTFKVFTHGTGHTKNRVLFAIEAFRSPPLEQLRNNHFPDMTIALGPVLVKINMYELAVSTKRRYDQVQVQAP